jgi:hypothetical protein
MHLIFLTAFTLDLFIAVNDSIFILIISQPRMLKKDICHIFRVFQKWSQLYLHVGKTPTLRQSGIISRRINEVLELNTLNSLSWTMILRCISNAWTKVITCFTPSILPYLSKLEKYYACIKQNISPPECILSTNFFLPLATDAPFVDSWAYEYRLLLI